MHKCIYCGKDYPEHKGMTLVMNSGKINHLCSAKCRKNLKLKRRKVRWVSKRQPGEEKVEYDVNVKRKIIKGVGAKKAVKKKQVKKKKVVKKKK